MIQDEIYKKLKDPMSELVKPLSMQCKVQLGFKCQE